MANSTDQLEQENATLRRENERMSDLIAKFQRGGKSNLPARLRLVEQS